MEHQPLIARIMTGGWVSPVAIAINGDLSYFRKLLIKELANHIPVDYWQPQIIVSDKEDQYNYEAAQSITARQIDINDENNWVFEDSKIMLKTGTTSDGVETCFLLADFTGALFLTKEIIDKAITNAINQYAEE